MSWLRKKRFWVGLGITAGFLYLVFRQVDLRRLSQALMTADYRWIAPALAVYLFGYWIRAVRWHYLLRSVKPIRARALFPPLILGFTVNNLLPARMGEFVLAYVVGKREGVSKSTVFATVFMQRLYDGLVMVLFAMLVLAVFRMPKVTEPSEFMRLLDRVLDIAAAGFLMAFCLIFAVMTWKEQSSRRLEQAARLLPGRWRDRGRKLVRSFMEGLSVMRSRSDSAGAFALTVLAWSAESAAYFFVLRAFHLALPVYASVMLMAVVNLGIMIPSSPGYIGPFEFFGVGTLKLFGVEASVSLPGILVIHTLVWLPITLWGLYYMWTLKVSFREMESAKGEGVQP